MQGVFEDFFFFKGKCPVLSGCVRLTTAKNRVKISLRVCGPEGLRADGWFAAYLPYPAPEAVTGGISERLRREVKHMGVVSVLLERLGELVHIVLISAPHIEAGYSFLRDALRKLVSRLRKKK